ncbi:MAG: type IV pilus modification protein PilV [Pseudomonadota bacterium]
MNRRTANKRIRPHRPGAAGQRGVGLVEVLTAVLILSIGLLGIAMVQTRSLSSNSGSMVRAMAVVASYTILDAMRADRANALTGSYTGEVDASACPTDSGTLAQTTLADWCANLRDTFGAAGTAPKGKIEVVAGSPETFQVTITFDDSRTGNGTQPQTVITSARL